MIAFVIGVGIGLLIRRSQQTTLVSSRSTVANDRVEPSSVRAPAQPLADAPVDNVISPPDAFLDAYKRATDAAWSGISAIDTLLEAGPDPELEKQRKSLVNEIRAMAAIARTRAAEILAGSGAVATLERLTQALSERAGELPAATQTLQAATAVVSAAKSFVTFLRSTP